MAAWPLLTVLTLLRNIPRSSRPLHLSTGLRVAQVTGRWALAPVVAVLFMCAVVQMSAVLPGVTHPPLALSALRAAWSIRLDRPLTLGIRWCAGADHTNDGVLHAELRPGSLLTIFTCATTTTLVAVDQVSHPPRSEPSTLPTVVTSHARRVQAVGMAVGSASQPVRRSRALDLALQMGAIALAIAGGTIVLIRTQAASSTVLSSVDCP